MKTNFRDRKNAKDYVKKMQLEAWDDYLKPIKKENEEVRILLSNLAKSGSHEDEINTLIESLKKSLESNRKILSEAVNDALIISSGENHESRNKLIDWKTILKRKTAEDSVRIYSANQKNLQ